MTILRNPDVHELLELLHETKSPFGGNYLRGVFDINRTYYYVGPRHLLHGSIAERVGLIDYCLPFYLYENQVGETKFILEGGNTEAILQSFSPDLRELIITK